MNHYEIYIQDKNGINRVWASGQTIDSALNNAIRTATEYAIERPDVVPMSVASIRNNGYAVELSAE